MMAHVLRTWALDAAAFCDALAEQDPTWGSERFDLAGGIAVLCGPGLYVNAALAAGLDAPLANNDLERLELRSAAIGVEAAIEVSPATHPEVLAMASERGYAPSGTRSALRRTLHDVDIARVGDSEFVTESAGDQLAVWQETSAIGWGHDTEARRRASDAFARAAAVVDGDGFLLVRRATDRTPIACASVTIRDDVATLGGMSTVPSARGRGVQSELIHHRLRLAVAAGCTVATATAEPGGDSERNLVRHGFEPWFKIDTLTRPDR